MANSTYASGGFMILLNQQLSNAVVEADRIHYELFGHNIKNVWF